MPITLVSFNTRPRVHLTDIIYTPFSLQVMFVLEDREFNLGAYSLEVFVGKIVLPSEQRLTKSDRKEWRPFQSH